MMNNPNDWGSSSFLRNSVLGKLLLVSLVVAMTMCHRIAGIVALIFVIALLNQDRGAMEGFAIDNDLFHSNRSIEGFGMGSTGLGTSGSVSNPLFGSTPAPISFKSPAEFRQKYCLKGVADDPTQSGTIAFNYMLSPAFFTVMDASGNPTLTKEQNDAFMTMEPNSFNKCTPLNYQNGSHAYETIHNICDPTCNWAMKPAPTPTSAEAPAMPTTDPALPTNAMTDTTTNTTTDTTTNTTEGFNPMSALRPYVRDGRHFITDGVANVKSVANRLKRRLF